MTLPKINPKTSKSITIHGKFFPSRKDLCAFYDINYKTFRTYIGKGKTPLEIVNNPPKHQTQRNWTPEEINTLKKYASSCTANEIGLMLDRTVDSIARKARNEKISMVKKGENHHASVLSNLQVAMVHTLCDAGFSPSEVHAAAFNHVVLSTINDIKYLRTHKG